MPLEQQYVKTMSYLSSRHLFMQRVRERDDRGWTLLHIRARKGDLKEKEIGKRRKLRSYWAEKKEKVAFSSSLSTAPFVQTESTTSFSLRMHGFPTNNQFSQASLVNIETQHLLIENFNLLNQIGSNLELSKVEENINLFYRTRENISTILNRMSGTQGSMSQLPPLPVLIDDNLFQSILPLASQVNLQSNMIKAARCQTMWLLHDAIYESNN